MKKRTPNQIALYKFLKNIFSLISLLIISVMVFAAIFAYVVAPDHTPDANEQFPKLAESPPGFTVQMIKVAKKTISTPSVIDKMLHGYERSYSFFPVDRVEKVENNKINIYPYRGAAFTLSQEELIQNGESFLFNKTFLLGTDQLGRDILSRLLIGSRISLLVGFFAVLISSFIGIILGGVAGYYRGWVDKIVLWQMSVFWSIPTILLAMAMFVSLKAYFSSNLWLIFIAIGITMWVSMARIIRGQVMAYRNIQFVEAAYSLAFSDFRIIFKHILPNLTGPIVVVMASNFANAILIESGLSFLGLGVQAPTPSWGSMLSEFKNFIGTDLSYLALLPGLLIMLLVLSFNLVGNGLRDALDIKN